MKRRTTTTTSTPMKNIDTIDQAAARFDELTQALASIPASDQAKLLDLLIEIIEFRAQLTQAGSDWDALRAAAGSLQSRVRQIIADEALKSMDERTAAHQALASRLEQIAARLRSNAPASRFDGGWSAITAADDVSESR